MKVQNLCGGPVFEVVDGLIVKDERGILHVVEKAAFKEIASDEWQDVTEACRTDGQGLYDPQGGHFGLGLHVAELRPDYRLVKEQLWREIPDAPMTANFPKRYEPVWAFRVEKKVNG